MGRELEVDESGWRGVEKHNETRALKTVLLSQHVKRKSKYPSQRETDNFN